MMDRSLQRLPPKARRRTWIALLLTASGLAAVPFVQRWLGRSNRTATLEFHAQARELGAVPFSNNQGDGIGLGHFRGRVVLLNIWATWCAPCREEMPTLDRLQATLGGPEFEVVALSIDQGGLADVRAFFARTGIQHLNAYVDTSGAVMSSLAAGGVPLTLLIDRHGRELARRLGPAVWDDPLVVAMIRERLAAEASRPRALQG